MFRITEDPSSGSLVQYLAKITRMILSCPLTRTWSVLWQHMLPMVLCIFHCISVYLTKYCIGLPGDGSSVIRNILEHF